MTLYPIKMIPAFKDYIWGGEKLKTEWNKNSTLDKVAESWELAAHKNGSSVCANGEYKGLTLEEMAKENPSCIGNRYSGAKFPVMIKLIDAKNDLSIQVHPDDEYALKNEGEFGKTEVWYVVDCEENAGLICGFKKTLTKEEYKEHIQNNTLLDVLNYTTVKKGDVFFIEPGTVHAIGKGLLIAEIQQNSDITYRVYDYGRKDVNGNQRELHIDKAIEVTDLNKVCEDIIPENFVDINGNKKKNICTCQYFNVTEYKVDETLRLQADEGSFNAITVLNGDGEIEVDDKRYSFAKGDTYFIPAGMGWYKVNGNCHLLLTKI